MKKTYVLDTNVLMTDVGALYSFEDNDVVLPLIVIEELDRHKDRQDEAGRNAREVSRRISLLVKEQKAANKRLSDGLPLPSGGTLRLLSSEDVKLDTERLFDVPKELSDTRGDNVILDFCLALKETTPLVLVSRDVLLRIKAEVVGVPCEDYKKLQVASNVNSLYTGVAEVELADISIDTFYQDQGASYQLAPHIIVDNNLMPNQFLVVKQMGTSKSVLTRLSYKTPDNSDIPSPGKLSIVKDPGGMKISAKNKEQRFALDLLFDPEVKLVTLVGLAGGGKTLLAIAAGLQQVLEAPKRYKSLVVCRPVMPLGKDIGFLPGTMDEKMEPWIAPIKDNLRFLLSQTGTKSKRGEDTLNMLFEDGTIEVEAMTFIRGRSIANAFMIIDEAQNLNLHELKTIITRVGENTKIVLTGDIEQIDNLQVDSVSNGLTIAVEKFKSQPIAGHVTLLKGERSELATIAAKIL